MIIVGINGYHGDSAACLLKDGKLIAAAEEERFRRVKHWAGFPSESIRYCLEEAKLSLNDVDYLAINQSPRANNWRKISYLLKSRPDLRFIMDRLRNRNKRKGIIEELELSFAGNVFRGKVEHVEHHLAHLASAHTVSPFDISSVVSVDGFGDFASSAWGIGHGNNINVEGRVYFPHSLGIFYMSMTQFIGFPTWGDEYKVMGLAPYGKPKYLSQMSEVLHLLDNGEFKLNLDFFEHHKKKTEIDWDGGMPLVMDLFSPAMEELFGPKRKNNEELTQKHMDIACSVQAMYEKAFFNLLNKLHQKHDLENLTLSGGCAMNSVANGKIRRNTPFENIYVQSAAGDAGGAIGAAFEVASKLNDIDNRFHMDHAYWGPSFSKEYCSNLLNRKETELTAANCSVELIQDEQIICDKTALAISEGLVIGWFQGRMEWGPRALGNRSILGDPRRADMKDILNLKIKRRESFRPFAPSILREHVRDWFEEEDEVPFMMQVFQIRESCREKIPAVTHVDGSGRLQTVRFETNSRYYRLISAFDRLTGVPIVLNTSFNENEPVVCKPEEALDCFLRTKMDVLVLGDYFIQRFNK